MKLIALELHLLPRYSIFFFKLFESKIPVERFDSKNSVISLDFQTENFFRKMEMKNVKDPIAFIDVQENGLYSKVNGILGLNKDSMKRKG